MLAILSFPTPAFPLSSYLVCSNRAIYLTLSSPSRCVRRRMWIVKSSCTTSDHRTWCCSLPYLSPLPASFLALFSPFWSAPKRIVHHVSEINTLSSCLSFSLKWLSSIFHLVILLPSLSSLKDDVETTWECQINSAGGSKPSTCATWPSSEDRRIQDHGAARVAVLALHMDMPVCLYIRVMLAVLYEYASILVRQSDVGCGSSDDGGDSRVYGHANGIFK